MATISAPTYVGEVITYHGQRTHLRGRQYWVTAENSSAVGFFVDGKTEWSNKNSVELVHWTDINIAPLPAEKPVTAHQSAIDAAESEIAKLRLRISELESAIVVLKSLSA